MFFWMETEANDKKNTGLMLAQPWFDHYLTHFRNCHRHISNIFELCPEPTSINHNNAKRPFWTRFITPFLSWQHAPTKTGKSGPKQISNVWLLACLFLLRLWRATSHIFSRKLGQYKLSNACDPAHFKTPLQIMMKSDETALFQNVTEVLPKWQCVVWFWWCTAQLSPASDARKAPTYAGGGGYADGAAKIMKID